MLHHPQPSAPLSPLNNPGRGQYNFSGLQNHNSSGQAPVSNLIPWQQAPMYHGPPMGGQQRQFGAPPSNISYPPGINGIRHFQQNQTIPFASHSQGPVSPAVVASHNLSAKPTGHHRQPSLTHTEQMPQPAPIGRPGPIGRPSSTTPDRKNKRRSTDLDVDNITKQLGSKALLDDADTLPSIPATSTLPNATPANRAPFGSVMESKPTAFGMSSAPGLASTGWGGFSPNVPDKSMWSGSVEQKSNWSTPHQPQPGAFGSLGAPLQMARSHARRPVPNTAVDCASMQTACFGSWYGR